MRRAAVSAVLLVLWFAASSHAQVRQVLLLQSLVRGNLTGDTFTGNLRVDMSRRSATPVMFTEVVVAPSGFGEIPEQATVDFLHSAYADRPKPDLVVTIGGPAATFARKYCHQVFPESPLLFAAVDQRFLGSVSLAEYETAVAVLNDMPGSVEGILQLFPRTSSVFMVTGAGPLGRFWRAQLQEDFRRFQDRVQFVWSEDLSYAEILQRVAALPADSAILYMTLSMDALGGVYPEDRVLADIHAVANAPLFGAQGAMMGHGIVGGQLMPIDELGRVTADIAVRILEGESPASLRPPVQKPAVATFDARELQRWGINESLLPPGHVVRFREPGVWERFKWPIVGGLSVLSAQALLIGALLISRRKRRLAEEMLRQNVASLDTARQALSNLSGTLMTAQEQERARVARELHDDVGQRMSFLAMDLARLRESLTTETKAQAQRLYDVVVALSRDLQAISHRLHSSKIEYLGLSAAAESFCKELSSRSDMRIDYMADAVPTTLPEGVGISLFRVLQEALTNAVKHSGAVSCKVTLVGSLDALVMDVIDDGRGLDVGAARRGRGLGLVSMEERLRLVNGTLTIESKPGAGTTVRAWVPLRQAPRDDAQAVVSSAVRPGVA